mmetsp:Transcript_7988/g.11526  ORF Transcript_7988/g.11526 Transcript_7988/m.11526 type:complete len:98 (+) Transcript_7988:381-674(+)
MRMLQQIESSNMQGRGVLAARAAEVAGAVAAVAWRATQGCLTKARRRAHLQVLAFQFCQFLAQMKRQGRYIMEMLEPSLDNESRVRGKAQTLETQQI